MHRPDDYDQLVQPEIETMRENLEVSEYRAELAFNPDDSATRIVGGHRKKQLRCPSLTHQFSRAPATGVSKTSDQKTGARSAPKQNKAEAEKLSNALSQCLWL